MTVSIESPAPRVNKARSTWVLAHLLFDDRRQEIGVPTTWHSGHKCLCFTDNTPTSLCSTLQPFADIFQMARMFSPTGRPTSSDLSVVVKHLAQSRLGRSEGFSFSQTISDSQNETMTTTTHQECLANWEHVHSSSNIDLLPRTTKFKSWQDFRPLEVHFCHLMCSVFGRWGVPQPTVCMVLSPEQKIRGKNPCLHSFDVCLGAVWTLRSLWELCVPLFAFACSEVLRVLSEWSPTAATLFQESSALVLWQRTHFFLFLHNLAPANAYDTAPVTYWNM